MFTNKFGCRNTTIIGTIIASFGFILSYFATQFYVLYLTIGVVVGTKEWVFDLDVAMMYLKFEIEKRNWLWSNICACDSERRLLLWEKRSLAIGIAVCGSGLGTFVLSPLNRILVDNYGLSGAFLIKAAIVLNLCVCGLLIRPVPVEPSEISKRSKKSKREALKKKNKSDESKKFLSSKDENCAAKNDNLGDSLPSVYINKAKPTVMKSNQNIQLLNEKNNLNVNTNDLNEFARSMPMLASNNVSGFSGKNLISSNSKSQITKSNNSTLDLMAHIRSLQSITGNDTGTKNSRRSLNLKNLIVATSNDNNEQDIEENEKPLKEKCQNMIDLSLLKDVVFIFFSVSNFLTSLGFNAPFIYIVDQAQKLNIDTNMADLLLSTIGISNTVGRVVLGIISDMKGVNRLYLYASVLTLCGIATVFEPFCTNFAGLFIYSVVFGFTSGIYLT